MNTDETPMSQILTDLKKEKVLRGLAPSRFSPKCETR